MARPFVDGSQNSGVVDVDAVFLEIAADKAADIFVFEGNDAFLMIDQVDFGLIEIGEDRSVFAADDSGTDDHQAPGEFCPVEDAVRVPKPFLVDCDVGKISGFGSGCNEEVIGADFFALFFSVSDLKRLV